LLWSGYLRGDGALPTNLPKDLYDLAGQPTDSIVLRRVGSAPIRLFSVQSSDPVAKRVTDEGDAAVRTQYASLEFLRSALR
jgi:hypothetical protein